eukprot:2486540-Prorocentrum_lima.AAC.1
MTSSLVGSEMCIRDRSWVQRCLPPMRQDEAHAASLCRAGTKTPRGLHPVSYTHLTLPTICSV